MNGRKLTLLGVVLLQLALHAPADAAPRGIERTVLRAAAAETPRALALTERLVNINSGTMNFAGVERIGAEMRGELEALGFTVRWIPMGEVGRAGHLVAEMDRGGKGRRLLLIGHLDTVFEPVSPFQRFERRGDVIEGPGVNDMKGGLAVMVSALRALDAAGRLADARIRIVLTGDEERPGHPLAIARRDLLAAAAASDVALEFESLAREDGIDQGSIARRSSSSWTLRVEARSGHSSGVFSEEAGFGAGYELARILTMFREQLREPNATFNVGLVAGGSTAAIDANGAAGSLTGKTNVIPGQAEARGDLRTLDDAQSVRIRDGMRRIVATPLPGTKSTLTFTDGYPAMPPTAGSRALLGELNAVNRDLGLPQMPELDPLKRGAGDIAFVASRLDGLVGLGVAGEGSHAPGETADVPSFGRQINRAALLMSRLLAAPVAR
jgi:glutamate carboxypeptidase